MIKQYKNGLFEANSWVYTNPTTTDTIVVDPGDELEGLLELIGSNNVTHIFITHGHIDHILGLEELKERYPKAIIVAHELTNNLFKDPTLNLSKMTGVELFLPEPDWTYNDESATITAAGQEWTLIHTPGHTPDHTIFFGQDQTIFGGDLIFEGGQFGRLDLPGAEPHKMKVSIAKILSAPEDSIVYPGHGNSFTIKDAKSHFNILDH